MFIRELINKMVEQAWLDEGDTIINESFVKHHTTKCVDKQKVKEIIEEIYKKYVVPDNKDVPGILIVALNHPISSMRAELLEWLDKK